MYKIVHKQEDIWFHLLTTPVALHGENGRVQALECLNNELGIPDAFGRRKPIPIEGSNFHIPADGSIIAIGQSPGPVIAKSTPESAVGKGSIISIDPNT